METAAVGSALRPMRRPGRPIGFGATCEIASNLTFFYRRILQP